MLRFLFAIFALFAVCTAPVQAVAQTQELDALRRAQHDARSQLLSELLGNGSCIDTIVNCNPPRTYAGYGPRAERIVAHLGQLQEQRYQLEVSLHAGAESEALAAYADDSRHLESISSSVADTQLFSDSEVRLLQALFIEMQRSTTRSADALRVRLQQQELLPAEIIASPPPAENTTPVIPEPQQDLSEVLLRLENMQQQLNDIENRSGNVTVPWVVFIGIFCLIIGRLSNSNTTPATDVQPATTDVLETPSEQLTVSRSTDNANRVPQPPPIVEEEKPAPPDTGRINTSTVAGTPSDQCQTVVVDEAALLDDTPFTCPRLSPDSTDNDTALDNGANDIVDRPSAGETQPMPAVHLSSSYAPDTSRPKNLETQRFTSGKNEPPKQTGQQPDAEEAPNLTSQRYVTTGGTVPMFSMTPDDPDPAVEAPPSPTGTDAAE